MTHPNGELHNCVLRTLNFCNGERVKIRLFGTPCECKAILQRLIEDGLDWEAEEWQAQGPAPDAQRAFLESLLMHERQAARDPELQAD